MQVNLVSVHRILMTVFNAVSALLLLSSIVYHLNPPFSLHSLNGMPSEVLLYMHKE